MFERKTAFIIGAGASKHFGYPTNAELLSLVRDEAAAIIDYNTRRPATYPMPQIVKQLMAEQTGTEANKAWKKFYNDCNELVNRIDLNRPIVIDHFLRDNPDLQVLGKTLIAKVIGQHEAKFFKDLDSNKLEENWVALIASKMADNCINPEDIKQNKINFITFNYDLSLERLLYGILTSRTRFKSIDFKYLFSEKRFLHVYGAISDDPLSPMPDNFLPTYPNQQQSFCDPLDAAYSFSMFMRLIDMHEKDENQFEIDRAKSILKEAEDIYVLGYSFDPSNNKRLGFPDIIQNRGDNQSQRRLYLTTYGADKVSVSRKASLAMIGYEGLLLTEMNNANHNSNQLIYTEKSRKKVYQALAHDFW